MKIVKVTVNLIRKCPSCQKVFEMEVEQKAFKRWEDGDLVQNCFPDMSINERELLISGMCGECYNMLYEGMNIGYDS